MSAIGVARPLHHTGPIAAIASYGDLVATAGYDNAVILWEARSRTPRARAAHDHLVNHCSFSPDGRWLVTASSDYTARIWAVPTLTLQAVLGGHDDDVDMAVFSPDGRRIATCALDRQVRVFDLEGHCLHTMAGHTGNVLSLAWTRDSRVVVSSSVDGTLRTWDAAGGVALRATDLAVRSDSVEIGADGVIYAGDDRGRIAVIEGDRVHFVTAHRAGIKKIALDERSGLLVALSYDRSMSVWRLGGPDRLQELERTPLPETVWARAAAVLPDGRIATGTFGSTYATFDVRTGRWDVEGVAAGLAVNALLNVEGRIYAVGDAGRVTVDGAPVAEMGSLCNFLVAASGRVFTGGQLGRLFDAATGAVVFEHHSPLNCGVAFVRQGVPHVAIGTYTGEIVVFALGPDGGLTWSTSLRVYENAVKGLSTDRGQLFSVCASTEVAWHRLDDWSLVGRRPRGHDRIANACCALGDGQFASVGRDRTLRIWRGEDVEVHHSPHAHSVKCLCVSGDRTKVATGSYGGTLAVFDLRARTWRPVDRPTTAGISSVVWDEARRAFLAGSYDGGIYEVPAA